jgi:hypothetical protein
MSPGLTNMRNVQCSVQPFTLKHTLVAMSERTGLSISQVTDEVLYTGLVDMQELDELEEFEEFEEFEE